MSRRTSGEARVTQLQRGLRSSRRAAHDRRQRKNAKVFFVVNGLQPSKSGERAGKAQWATTRRV